MNVRIECTNISKRATRIFEVVPSDVLEVGKGKLLECLDELFPPIPVPEIHLNSVEPQGWPKEGPKEEVKLHKKRGRKSKKK